MRAVRRHRYGDPDVLHVETVPDPVPRGREIVIAVGGVVAAVGEGVSRFSVGDAVFGDLLYESPECLAEYVVATEDAPLTTKPDDLGRTMRHVRTDVYRRVDARGVPT